MDTYIDGRIGGVAWSKSILEPPKKAGPIAECIYEAIKEILTCEFSPLLISPSYT